MAEDPQTNTQVKEVKKEVKEAKEEVKATKEEIKEAKQELRETKAEIKEVKQEMKKVSRLALAEDAEREIKNRIITVITTALALVAALFWQTAINDTIKTFIPVSGAWQYEIAVALGVTVIAAVAIYILSKSMGAAQK
jgi:hypothetical protein